MRAVCFTRRESIIFYVRCAAQVRSIPFVLLPESRPENRPRDVCRTFLLSLSLYALLLYPLPSDSPLIYACIRFSKFKIHVDVIN